MNKNDKHLTVKRYGTLVVIILFLVVMVFVMIDLERFLRTKELTPSQIDTVRVTTGEPIGQLTEEALADDVLFIDGSDFAGRKDVKKIKKAMEKEKTIIFSSLPTAKQIEKYELKEILGIQAVGDKQVQTKLNLVEGFMLGGFHQLDHMEYEALDLELTFSTKVYAYAEENEPIIWRNTYQGHEVYSVNGPFMETNAYYGIVAALLTKIEEDYIYPVMNMRLMVYDNFPYLSDQNKQQLEKNYNRDAMTLQHDILFPDLFSINKRRDFIPNGFFNVDWTEQAPEIKPHHRHELHMYQQELFKEGGEIGLSVDDQMADKQTIYHELFKDTEVSHLLINDDTENIEEILARMPTVKSVFGPFNQKKTFTFLNDQALYLPITTQGMEPSGDKEFEMLSWMNAMGLIVHKLDIEDIIQPADGKEKWTAGHQEYVKFIDTYRKEFYFLDNRNLTEGTAVAKNMVNYPAEIKKSPEQITLTFAEHPHETYYFLRTTKEIKKVANGFAEEIEDQTYLITATGQEVVIELMEES